MKQNFHDLTLPVFRLKTFSFCADGAQESEDPIITCYTNEFVFVVNISIKKQELKVFGIAVPTSKGALLSVQQ